MAQRAQRPGTDRSSSARSPLASTDLTLWLALRRADAGGVAVLDGSYYHHGHPVPQYLNAPFAELVEAGRLTLAETDPTGMRAVTLTAEGHELHAVLCGKRRVASPPSDEGRAEPSAP